jgi:hypothetical protein
MPRAAGLTRVKVWVTDQVAVCVRDRDQERDGYPDDNSEHLHDGHEAQLRQRGVDV